MDGGGKQASGTAAEGATKFAAPLGRAQVRSYNSPMPLSALYSDTVLEHNRSPRNFGPLRSATHQGEGHNASCGDHVSIQVECSAAGHVLACCFTGESCAICTASASMLSEAAAGKNASALALLRSQFEAMMEGRGDASAVPGALGVFAELGRHPARRNCALLPFNALLCALQNPLPIRKPEMIEYRAATEDDIPAIVALVESAYRGDVSKQGWTTEADMLDGQRTDPVSVASLLLAPNSRVLLALRDGELLGCAHVEGQQGVGYFGMFAVSPLAQGSGLGAALLAEAERIARSEYDCAIMTMTVISIRRELIAFYTRRGYKATGQSKPFPYGDERFGIPKRADLEFAVFAKALV
jgi:SUF system NifU family Fe-S assembly protein